MKTKIIGIALAAIMLASLFAAMAPTGSAVSQGQGFNYIYADPDVTYRVLVGQDVQFNGTDGGRPVWSNPENVKVQRLDEGTWYDYRGPWDDGKAYNVNWDPDYTLQATNGTVNVSLSVQTPDIPLKLKVGTKEVSNVAKETIFKVDVGGINLFDNDVVDLVIKDSKGKLYKTTPDGINVDNIRVSTLKALTFNSTDWDVETYTFQVVTEPDKACGLDDNSVEKTLKVIKGEIAIAADKTEVAELSSVKITVTGVEGDPIEVWCDSDSAVFEAGIGNTPAEGDESLPYPYWIDEPQEFADKIDEDGKREYSIKFTDTGSFKVRVNVTSGAREDEKDDVDITVVERQVTLDLPGTVAVGQKITIMGTATTGTYVDVYVEDVLYSKLNDLVIEDGEFEKEVTTTDVGIATPDETVRLKAWIDDDQKYQPKANPPTGTADGEETIRTIRPEISVELSTTTVAVEEDFYIRGTASGMDDVKILIIPPSGGGGEYITSGDKKIDLESATVSKRDDKFEKKLTADEDAQLGWHDVYVLSVGMDNNWGNTRTSDLTKALKDNYGIDLNDQKTYGTKTQGDFASIIIDLTKAAGADDLLGVARIKVEEISVELGPIADVGAGDPLEVTGTTNRKEGFPIVVTVDGPKKFSETVRVENGTFNATFDTTGAPTGTYSVMADDGDGHIAEGTVKIGAAAPATPTPAAATPTPTETAAPTPVTTPTPAATPAEATPTPEEVPGFGALFAIAGLLAVAYLVLRIKK